MMPPLQSIFRHCDMNQFNTLINGFSSAISTAQQATENLTKKAVLEKMGQICDEIFEVSKEINKPVTNGLMKSFSDSLLSRVVNGDADLSTIMQYRSDWLTKSPELISAVMGAPAVSAFAASHPAAHAVIKLTSTCLSSKSKRLSPISPAKEAGLFEKTFEKIYGHPVKIGRLRSGLGRVCIHAVRNEAKRQRIEQGLSC